MKIKTHYFLIPLCTIAVAALGSSFTNSGMDWYNTINLPDFTPDGSIIGAVWTLLFILATISGIWIWNNKKAGKKRNVVMIWFAVNGALNALWSYLFFGSAMIDAAFYEAIILGISVLIMMYLAWPISKKAAMLLMPYAGWVFFASYLTFAVSQLN